MLILGGSFSDPERPGATQTSKAGHIAQSGRGSEENQLGRRANLLGRHNCGAYPKVYHSEKSQ
jgi:hypothetical protein